MMHSPKNIINLFALGVIGVVLAFFTARPGMANTSALPPTPTEWPETPQPQLFDSHIIPGPYGTWMYAGPDESISGPVALNGATSGGPDDFGYLWQTTTYSWIDATAGVDTGLSSAWQSVRVTLPFPFKFYEHTYNEVYVHSGGFMTFTPNQFWWPYPRFPNRMTPNNTIAPYGAYLTLSSSGPTGRVYFMSGGTAPNRYFVIEWYRVSSHDSTLTFEVILHENGDIVFQYENMQYGTSYSCPTAGIEDDLGIDGLTVLTPMNGCERPNSYSAVRFTRPGADARVKAFPLHQGRFTSAGDVMRFEVQVRNTGELGPDVYDVTVSSAWPVNLYQSDGVTLLADTDGDTIPDVGSLAEGATYTIVAEVHAPAGAQIGDANTAGITFTSSLDVNKAKTVYLEQTVPPAFAEAFIDETRQRVQLRLVQASGVTNKVIASVSDGYLYSPTATQLLSGGFLVTWIHRYENGNRVWVSDVYYAVTDRNGNLIQSPVRLINHSSATDNIYIFQVSRALVPNGKVGLIWAEKGNTETLRFAVLVPRSNGTMAVGRVTQIQALSNPDDWMGSPTIAATAGSFIVGWDQFDSNTSTRTAYYAALDTSGLLTRPPTSFGEYSVEYVQTTLDNQVLLFYFDWVSGETRFFVLDAAGNIVAPARVFRSDGAWGLAGSVLPGGNLILGWGRWNDTLDKGEIGVAVLERGTYNLLFGPVYLNHPHATGYGDIAPAFAIDVWGNVALTWEGDGSWELGDRFFALLDTNANVVVPPTQFWNTAYDMSRGGNSTTTYLTFGDVWPTHWAAQYIERLANSGITQGCGLGQYCPNNFVTRAEMAVFLERGMHGASYQPPPVASSSFNDVPDTFWAKDWIEALYNDGITSGCGNGNYCPNEPVTRAQMAVFLLRAKYGASYQPPTVTSSSFNDVPDTFWAKDWIEALYNEGITSGCGNGNYCPNEPVTRAQMAVFLVRTFNLP